jgi:hypothetical protein
VYEVNALRSSRGQIVFLHLASMHTMLVCSSFATILSSFSDPYPPVESLSAACPLSYAQHCRTWETASAVAPCTSIVSAMIVRRTDCLVWSSTDGVAVARLFFLCLSSVENAWSQIPNAASRENIQHVPDPLTCAFFPCSTRKSASHVRGLPMSLSVCGLCVCPPPDVFWCPRALVRLPPLVFVASLLFIGMPALPVSMLLVMYPSALSCLCGVFPVAPDRAVSKLWFASVSSFLPAAERSSLGGLVLLVFAGPFNCPLSRFLPLCLRRRLIGLRGRGQLLRRRCHRPLLPLPRSGRMFLLPRPSPLRRRF